MNNLMNVLGAFDANAEENQETNGSFEPIPEGWYEVMTRDSALKTTKAGNGQYISVGFEVLDGKFARRIVWNNYNIQNPKPATQEIGLKQFASFCKALGIARPQSTEELSGKVLSIRVRITPAKGQWEAGNEAVEYKAGPAIGSAAPARAAAPAPAAQPAAAPAAPPVAKKPWE